MTMAFTVVALSAVNMGFVMRRERQVPWSSPLFPYMGWIMLRWVLTVAAVETRVLQRILDTVSLTGAQWALVAGMSLISPLFVAVDKIVQIRRLDREQLEHPFADIAGPRA
jgi:Ca2+-transporting ATPase